MAKAPEARDVSPGSDPLYGTAVRDAMRALKAEQEKNEELSKLVEADKKKSDK